MMVMMVMTHVDHDGHGHGVDGHEGGLDCCLKLAIVGCFSFIFTKLKDVL